MALHNLMIIALNIFMLWHYNTPRVNNGVSISLCLGEATQSLENYTHIIPIPKYVSFNIHQNWTQLEAMIVNDNINMIGH